MIRVGRGNITYTLLTLEAFISGFYVIITRSLAPIFFTVMGFEIKDIIKLNILGYLLAILIMIVIYHKWDYIKHNVKNKLILFHGFERVAWGLIPIVTVLSVELLYVDYALAIALTIPTSVCLNMILYGLFDEATVKNLIARRAALGALSSVIGQITAVLVLSSLHSFLKYLYLYVLATVIGLLATAILILSKVSKEITINDNKKLISDNEGDEVKVVNVFIFLVLFLSSNAVLSIIWAPYIIRYLCAPDYFAAMIGLVQTITAIFSSLFWLKRNYHTYRLAVFGVTLIPVMIFLTRTPDIHLVLAISYSFMATGANLLASFIYANTAKKVVFRKAITLLTSANALAQVLGLSIVYTVNIGIVYMFLLVSMLQAVTAIIAATTIPEVAVTPERYVKIYSRLLYNMSISSYNFTIMTTKNTVLLTLRLLGVSIIATIIYMIYKLLFYLISLGTGVT